MQTESCQSAAALRLERRPRPDAGVASTQSSESMVLNRHKIRHGSCKKEREMRPILSGVERLIIRSFEQPNGELSGSKNDENGLRILRWFFVERFGDLS